MADTGQSLHVVLLSYRGNMFCGGQGVYLVNLARALVARGHRVRIMAGPPEPDPVEGATMEILPDDNYINRPGAWLPPHDPISVLKPLNLLEYALARAGANPEMLAFSLRCYRRIRSIHQEGPVDVVHDNQGLGYGLLLVRAMGLPVVATIHHPLQVDRGEDLAQTSGLTAKARRSIYYPLVMQKLVARRISRVITVSAFSGDLVSKAYGLDPGRMAVAPNGVDTSVFRRLPDVEREPGRLLFVGSTEDRKKGVVHLMRALAGLPPRFRLVVVDGRRYPGRVYAQELVEKLGIADRVEFKDKVSTEELVEEYNRAEMMVMPSLFEGFGLPALEAMACGTPLVCTGAGALPEVVGDHAVVVAPRSADAIKEAVLALDQNGEARERMSQAGMERAQSLFTWERAAALVEEQYLAAIARAGDGSPLKAAANV